MTRGKCWSWRHEWESDPKQDILVNTPTAWTFPKVCTRCGATEVDRQEKSIQQVVAEGRARDEA